MQIVILDGKEMINEIKTHQILKEKLDLPYYYGENFSALWDCLTGWISLPLTIIWNDFEDSKKQLGTLLMNF
ncbi:barstar family protein [Clostridium oceanicum]|uniref:Barstar (barnase inhibitor) domain-containing protein n=1 Tax=Clostridium oceanicum TaxID=1543 RepID=A0ABP3USM8_9CLOT